MTVTQFDIAPLKGGALWGFLEQAKTLRLATIIGRQPINISPVWFVIRSEHIYFFIDPTVGDPGRAATPASQHLPALEKGSDVSGVIDDGEDMSNFRGVQVTGSVTPVKATKLKEELLDITLVKYFYEGHPHLEHFLSKGAVEERHWYKIIAKKLNGWDRRLLPQPPIMERRILPSHLRKS